MITCFWVTILLFGYTVDQNKKMLFFPLVGYAIINFSVHYISDMHTALKTLACWDLSVQEWFLALNPKKQQKTYNKAYISRNR